MAALLHEGLPCESAPLSWAGPPRSVGGGEGKLKPPSLSCDLGSIDAISMLTSALESRNGSSPTGRTKRRDSKAPLTENLTVLQSHLPKTKESSPRGPLSALQVHLAEGGLGPRAGGGGGRTVPTGGASKVEENVVQTTGWAFKPVSMCILQAPFVKNPSRAKFLLRLSCRSLHFGLCFSPPSPSFNLPCLWKCRRHLRPRQTHPRHLHRHPHHLEKMGRSRKWRWKMRGARSRLPQEQRKMLP